LKGSIFYIAVVLFCLSSKLVSAQGNIDVFADVRNNDSLQKLVNIFTAQLKRSTGANFITQPVAAYKGRGIYLSTAKESQAVKPSAKLLNAGVEAYSVDVNEQAVQILGNSNMAIGHGIFSYLEFLGYRYYFANPDWHIIPSKPVLFRKWSIVSGPSFYHRRIWYGYGTGSKIADADYDFWVLANKLGGSINAYFGHAYEDIAIRNKDVFLKHPEWFYPVNTKDVIPPDAKFDMTKEDLVQFIIADVEKRIENSLKNKTNAYKMISLGPSDGLGTCNTPACQRLGTITDRVYYLTNRVAKAIQKKYPSTLIGCMAYGEYSTPPTKKVEPNVFVAITTAFNGSKYPVDQLVDEWRKKGPIIGIYDYFSWFAWDFDVPGQSLASRPTAIVKNIKKYYAKGVRSYEGESSMGWVTKGLGYYLAAQQMWNANFNPAPAKKEFFKLCFGKAAGLMETLWNEWENNSYTPVRESDLARWMDYTTEAEKTEQDANVRKRLFQVKCYLHWLFLYRKYVLSYKQSRPDEARLSALLNFGYRKLDDGSVSGFPSFYVLGNGSGIQGMAYDDKAKWKTNSGPVSSEEINRLIRDDRSGLKTYGLVTKYSYAKEFQNIPNLSRYRQMIADSSSYVNSYWYTNEWVIEIKKKGAANYIDFLGNSIADPTNLKPIKISIYPFTADGNVEGKQPVFYYEYNETRVRRKISLDQLAPGYYTMIIEDPVKIYIVNFSPVINFSNVMRNDRQLICSSIFNAFIYVPEGTKKFNVSKTIVLNMVTPTGRKITFPDDIPADAQIEVLKGEEGLWHVKPVYGKFFVEGIPPYFSTSASQMLIPKGVK